MSLDLKSDHWAYDLSKDIINKGEIFDEDVIKQSISGILSTYSGERVMNPLFGSRLPEVIFEGINTSNAEELIDDVLNDIETFENRIIVDRKNVKLILDTSKNILEIFIPYVIVKQKIVSFFNKKIAI
mgnify:CR=1 FL=1